MGKKFIPFEHYSGMMRKVFGITTTYVPSILLTVNFLSMEPYPMIGGLTNQHHADHTRKDYPRKKYLPAFGDICERVRG